MFGARYSRLKFWIWSILLLIPWSVLTQFVKATENNLEFTNGYLTFSILLFIVTIMWINALSNRIRDYGSNPWISLFALIPLVNIGLALYYGIANKKNIVDNTINSNDNSDTSLTKAVYNHSKDIASEIKPTINQYKENHKTSKSEPTFQNYNLKTKNSYSINKKLANVSNTTQTYETRKASPYIPTIKCPNCKESNNTKNEFCWKCKSKLDYRKKVQNQNYEINANVDNSSNKPIANSKIPETKKDKPFKNTIFKNEDSIYEQVMIEIEEDKKVKSTWAKALANSDGNKDKAESLYIKDRVLDIKKDLIEKNKQKEKEELQKQCQKSETEKLQKEKSNFENKQKKSKENNEKEIKEEENFESKKIDIMDLIEYSISFDYYTVLSKNVVRKKGTWNDFNLIVTSEEFYIEDSYRNIIKSYNIKNESQKYLAMNNKYNDFTNDKDLSTFEKAKLQYLNDYRKRNKK